MNEPLEAGDPRLDSWKEIAEYLGRNTTTARRWEREEDLPVHRHSHKSRSSVYAYPSEIDAWKMSRKTVPEPIPAPPGTSWRVPTFALAILLCLVMVGNGIRPASAQQAGGGRAARQVWVTGSSQDPLYGAVSADAHYATFTDWETGDLAIQDLVQGTSRHLTDTGGWERSGDYAQNSVFSPDGKEIAYLWNVEHGDFHSELRTIPVASGDARTIWRSQRLEEYVVPQAWAPDRAQLLVLHGLADGTSQLAMLSVQDGTMRPLKSFAWQRLDASLSPDGRWVAYDSPPDSTTQARDIFLLPTGGGAEVALVQNPANDAEPIWSPDGSHVFFLSDRTGQEALWSVGLENGKPGNAGLIKAGLNGAERVWMTRSGTLYYVIPGSSSPNIYTAELGPDGKVSKPPTLAVQTFVNSNNGPSISPDGQYLAYSSFRSSSPRGMTVVIQTRKTGGERVVNTTLPNMVFGYGPMWFPDGRSLLVVSRVPQGPGPNFYRIDVATGRAELLFRSSGPIQGYKLAPDGRSIFYTVVSQQDSKKIRTRLVRFDLRTHRETELKGDEFSIAVAVSPDSKQIAYLVQEQPGAESYLAVMPASGGPAREVFRGSPWNDASRYNTLAWTPDRRYLLFVRGTTGDGPNVLWRVPVSGGPAEQMGLTIPGKVKSPQIDPLGRQLFFSANENSPSEIWTLENFVSQTAVAGK